MIYQNITKEELEIKYNQCGSIRALADFLGMHNSSVRLLLQKLNIKYKKNPIRRCNDRFVFNKQELEDKYIEFKSRRAVANYFNTSISTIKKSFRKFGITHDKLIKIKFNEQFFSTNTPESFYLAGFIAADGNVHDNTLQIILGIKDTEHLQKIKNMLSFEGELKIFKGKPSYIDNRKINGGDSIRLTCSAKNTINDLKKFNIVPNKSKIYDLPQWLIYHPLIHHFIRGYFDGDGSIGIRKLKTQNKLRWSIAGNIWFLEKIQNILEKECYINHNNIYKKTDTFGHLEYSGNIVVPKICEFLYNNSTYHLDRKYNIYKDWLSNKC